MTRPTEKQLALYSWQYASITEPKLCDMGVDAIRPSITYEDACFLSILIVSRRTCSFVMRCNDGFQ